MSAAKRPRLTGSFSPASPPYHLAKGVEQPTERPVRHPDTPTSPPREQLQQQQNMATVIPGLSMSSGSAPSAASTVNTQLADDTPASSVAGTVSFAAPDKDGDAVMSEEATGGGDGRGEGEETSATAAAVQAAEKHTTHSRTDHERIQQGLRQASSGQDALQDFLLNIDTGPLFKLYNHPHPRQQQAPHPSRNFTALFHLSDIAKSVERKDPVTGQKTNKLRKSYENQIKQLGIAGRNKAIDGRGDFETLLQWPEEEYRNQRVHGKDMAAAADPAGAWAARLERALALSAPQTRLTEQENDRWKTLIGTEEPASKGRPVGQDGLPQQLQQPQQQQQAPAVGGVGGGKGQAIGAASRPERAGKKRRYNDSSFAGYGEGFVDDHADSEDDNPLAARRKRSKV